MPRNLPSFALFVTFAAVGCAQATGGRGTAGATAGGKGDNTEQDSSDDGGTDQPLSDHRDAALACEATADHLRSHLNAARTDAIVDLERDRNDCLVRANDGARGVIDGKLEAASDPDAGQTDRLFRSHRDDAVAACSALVEAHADAAGDGLAAIASSCIAGVELHLAFLLDAYVDFGVAPFSIHAERDRYESCYADMDAALEAAPEDEAAAKSGLAGCIAAEQDALLPELAGRVAANFAGRDEVTIEGELRDALQTLHETRGKMCTIAVHAGPATDDLGLAIAECEVDVALQAGEMIRWVAPDLLPDDAGSATTGDGESSSSDAGGSESSSSDGGSWDSSTSY
jgi:hypothetical protein